MGFRHYNQNQLVLFPHTFEDLISKDHPVRVVNEVLEKVNLSKLLNAYRKEGNPSYHPLMMIKVMVFAYMENIYSSRKIEKAMRENVLFMWLSNMNIADHNTIARFRSQKLQSAFKDIFTQVVLLLAEEGLITLKQVYTDGTKIEAQAGRYTFIWGKSIKTNKEKMQSSWKNSGVMPKASLLMRIKILSRQNLRRSARRKYSKPLKISTENYLEIPVRTKAKPKQKQN